MAPFARPPVAELVLRVYDRVLHPELFDAVAERRVERGGWRLVARVTRAGHVLTWDRGGVGLTEAAGAADEPLPAAGRRVSHPFGGERHGRCSVATGVRYQVSSQVEVLPPEQFAHVHEELLADGARKGLVCRLHPDHRFGLSPIGVVIVDALPGALSVSAFHTFPDELAVVKTQSLIEGI